MVSKKTIKKKVKSRTSKSRFKISSKEDRTYNGIVYDSKTEMLFMKEYIEPRIKSGEISSYERQIPFILQEGCVRYDGKKILPIKYIADFILYYPNGTREIIDVKIGSSRTSDFKLKEKMMWSKYPNEVFYCMTKAYGGWHEWSVYEKLKKERKKENIK